MTKGLPKHYKETEMLFNKLSSLSKDVYKDPKLQDDPEHKEQFQHYFNNMFMKNHINYINTRYNLKGKEKRGILLLYHDTFDDQPVKDHMVAKILSKEDGVSDLGSEYHAKLVSVKDGCDIYHNEINNKGIKYFRAGLFILYIQEHLEQEFSELYDELLRSKERRPDIDCCDLEKKVRALKLKALTPLMKSCFTQEHEKSDKEYFIDTAVQGFMRSFTQNQESYRIFTPGFSDVSDKEIQEAKDDPKRPMIDYLLHQKDLDDKDPSKRMIMRRRVLRSGSDYDKELLATLNHVIKSDNSTGIDMPYLVIADMIQRRNSGVLFPQDQKALTDYIKNLQRNHELYDNPVKMFKTEALKMLRSKEI